ncbi:MAG: DUF1501 domain-containing protein [Gemmataceae bacterium]
MRSVTDLSRRQFLRTGAIGAGAAGLALGDLGRLSASSSRDVNCILLFLVGGPSQLDTFDLKPDAPESVRGPFRPIRTSVPGLELSELLPRTAAQAKHVAVVRSVHHTAAPIHETGHQLMQTGRLFRNGQEHPHYGAVLSYLRGGPRGEWPGAWPVCAAMTPGPIYDTGVRVSHGQTAAHLGPDHAPVCFSNSVWGDDELLLERYGNTDFGRSCLTARQLVEDGVRFVTVNMFGTVFGNVTWDCHADGNLLASTLIDYRDTLCPTFDMAYSALLDDLHQRGLLANTLVLAMGEFGRTPQINPRGGRDHWTGCWSILFAGAGIRGGQVVGASDNWAAEPKDRPVEPAHIAATVYRALGFGPRDTIPGPDDHPIPLADAGPIGELI